MNDPIHEPLLETFKERELEVLSLVAEGWSNREIADKLFVTVHTVRWHLKQIYSKLGEHSRTRAIARARELGLLDTETAVDALHSNQQAAAPPHNLPTHRTEFVGREQALIDVTQLLDSNRLLTLTGPGGTGKTRLALQVASQMVDSFVQGVTFVPLSSIHDAALVTRAVADELDLTEKPGQSTGETLIEYLRDRHMLLVLDNFEHVVAAASLIADLLEATSALKIIVTSREILHLYGEQDYNVPPLTLPDLDTPDLIMTVSNYEAVTLFEQRARFIKPDFQITHDNALQVAEICVRLDGLPLAIELAAARSNMLTPQGMLERLKNGLEALTGGARDLPSRQQTLRNTIDWSYNLLEPGEQILFARIGVFRGGGTMEAVEAICAEELLIDFFEGIASLIDKSLLQQHEDDEGQPRFVMLETIREYAGECLQSSDDADLIYERHATYFLSFAERAMIHEGGQHQILWLDRMEQEHDNLRIALSYLAEQRHSAERECRLVAAMGWYWHRRSYWSEGRQHVTNALRWKSDIPPKLYADVLAAGGHCAHNQADYDVANEWHQEALEIYRQVGEPGNVAFMLFCLAARMSNADDVLTQLETALDLAKRAHADFVVRAVLINLGEFLRVRGDYDRARAIMHEGLELARASGDKLTSQYQLVNLADIAYGEADYETAQKYLHEALATSREIKDRFTLAVTLRMAGEVTLLKDQDVDRALSMYEESLALGERIGSKVLLIDLRIAMARALTISGDLPSALELCEEALRIAETQPVFAFVAVTTASKVFDDVAGILAAGHNFAAAAQLLGTSDALRDESGEARRPTEQQRHQQLMTDMRHHIGEDAFHNAYEAGQNLSLNQTISFAREQISTTR